MTTPPNARIMFSKRAGTFTNGSCSSMIATSAIASTICSATSEPASVAFGTSVPTSFSRRRSTATRPISPSRAGSSVLSRKPMKSAGTTWTYWKRGWSGIVSSAAFQTTALSRIEARLSPSAAMTHHQADVDLR